MTTFAALRWGGTKMRRTMWSEDRYIELTGDRFYLYLQGKLGMLKTSWSPTSVDLTAEDWDYWK